MTYKQKPEGVLIRFHSLKIGKDGKAYLCIRCTFPESINYPCLVFHNDKETMNVLGPLVGQELVLKID